MYKYSGVMSEVRLDQLDIDKKDLESIILGLQWAIDTLKDYYGTEYNYQSHYEHEQDLQFLHHKLKEMNDKKST